MKKCKEILERVGLNVIIKKRILSKKDKQFSYRIYVPVRFKNEAHLSIKTERLQL